MKPEKGVADQTIGEAKEAYSKMSLLQLLAEENMMTELMHRRNMDPVRRRLQKILRSEIEGRLR